jgi:hypothetical protein
MAAHNRTGHGITITFATSGFEGEILDVTPPTSSLADIKTSHTKTTGSTHTYVPGDLVENGALTFDIAFEPTDPPPIDADPEVITIAIPGVGSEVFTGYINNVAPRAPMEDRMVSSVTVKVSGTIA